MGGKRRKQKFPSLMPAYYGIAFLMFDRDTNRNPAQDLQIAPNIPKNHEAKLPSKIFDEAAHQKIYSTLCKKTCVFWADTNARVVDFKLSESDEGNRFITDLSL